MVKMTDALSALAAEKFVSLTTFKKDGTAVATPMWIGRDGDHLFAWTPADSWKAKRAKNNPRVVLVPCSRAGKVREGAEPVDGIAEVITDPATVQRLAGVIRRKYGLEFIVVTFIERVVARGRKPRLILSIALTG
jgi:PPOX class probable F420-dependent enzyme